MSKKTHRRALKLAALMSALMAATPALSQTAAPEMAAAPAHVIVTGEGRAEVTPDMAQMMLGVSDRGDTAAAAMAAIATRMTKVVEALKAQGIEARDIQTSGLTVAPQFNYDQNGAPPQLMGYAASNMVTVRVRDLAKLGAIMDEVIAAGATDFNGLTYGLNDPAPVEDAARRDAVAKARARAELYAGELGMKLGPVRMLSEQAIMAAPQPMMMRSDASYGKGGAMPLESGELSVTATVNVEYLLQP